MLFETLLVIHKHLNQVLVKRIVASSPADVTILDFSGFDIDHSSNQTIERFSLWWLGVQEFLLPALNTFCVLIITGKIRKSCPLSRHQFAIKINLVQSNDIGNVHSSINVPIVAIPFVSEPS